MGLSEFKNQQSQHHPQNVKTSVEIILEQKMKMVH